MTLRIRLGAQLFPGHLINNTKELKEMKIKTIITGMAMATIACLSIMTTASCKKDDSAKSMKFSASAVEVGIGAIQTVTVSNCTAPLTVKSSDEKVATVSASKTTITIKGVAAGSATISVTDANKLPGSIKVTVKEALSFDKTSLSVSVGKEEVINVKSGTAPYTVTVKDTKIATATVKDAAITIKGVAAGTTTLTVTDSKKVTGTVTIVVNK